MEILENLNSDRKKKHKPCSTRTVQVLRLCDMAFLFFITRNVYLYFLKWISHKIVTNKCLSRYETEDAFLPRRRVQLCSLKERVFSRSWVDAATWRWIFLRSYHNKNLVLVSFPFIRKPIIFRKWKKTLDFFLLLSFVPSHCYSDIDISSIVPLTFCIFSRSAWLVLAFSGLIPHSFHASGFSK